MSCGDRMEMPQARKGVGAARGLQVKGLKGALKECWQGSLKERWQGALVGRVERAC